MLVLINDRRAPERRVDEEDGGHLHVEQDGAGHDDEAVGVAILEFLEGEGHEVPAHNVTKTRREGAGGRRGGGGGVQQAGGDSRHEQGDNQGVGPAQRTLVVLDVVPAKMLQKHSAGGGGVVPRAAARAQAVLVAGVALEGGAFVPD